MGWPKIKECLHYNFGSVVTKQHVASMLIDQQQTASETLQEYVPRFLDLLLKSSSLPPCQAKDLTHITHFICNLHNQKLQHYLLGKISPQFEMSLHWHRKRMWNSASLKVYKVMMQAMKSTALLVNKLITKTALDHAMLVVAYTLYDIAMSQYAINADQT